MTSSATLSMLGAVYAADLRELGADGFRQWLTDCFAGPEPKLIGPHFIDDELDHQPFGDIFAKVVPELSDDELAIARSASARSLRSYKKDNSTYEGLYNLARLAEALQVENAANAVYGALKAAFDAGHQDPPDYAEAYYLRETLEVLFRLVALSSKPPSNMLDICAWAFGLATQSPYPKKLKFALAPLYVLGRLHARDTAPSGAKETSWTNALDGSLLDGFREDDDLFHEFYVFEWEGEIFPYDVERLRLEVRIWLSARKIAETEDEGTSPDTHRKVSLKVRYVRRLTLGDREFVSATSGQLGRLSEVTSVQLLEEVERQLA